MEDKSRRNKLLFLILAGCLGLVFMVIEGYQLIAFSDSTTFCGKLCHNVMYPEYTAYQNSPHSRVLCATCHVGSGASYLVKSKINGIPMIWATLTGHFERPIPVPVMNLRPARETCEDCHRPDKFTGDLVKSTTTYDSNEANTAHVDTRVLRIGTGSAQVASGIHWHIAARVWYLPLDQKRQQIAWVGIEGPNGSFSTEFVDPAVASQVTPQSIESGKRLMDCIDCHNRATHIFQTAEALIDTSLLEGSIDVSLPYIKREGVKALDPISPSLDAAYQKVDAIADFYKTTYPAVYASNKAGIDKSITQLKNVARLTTFPDMKATADSYLNNIGHLSSAGCFRCHGKLVDSKGGQVGKAVDASCDLCHYTVEIPAATPGNTTPPPTTTTIPTIPHTLVGRADCSTCHASNTLPSDHSGRTNSICQSCHKPAGRCPHHLQYQPLRCRPPMFRPLLCRLPLLRPRPFQLLPLRQPMGPRLFRTRSKGEAIVYCVTPTACRPIIPAGQVLPVSFVINQVKSTKRCSNEVRGCQEQWTNF